tara:strand:- start:2210 stop:4441 length:2232 start_codon:yes stop_codon:yes gene_type:complete
MAGQIIPFEGIDKLGFISDTPAVNLPMGAWSDVNNVRFDDGSISKMKGHIEIFGSATGFAVTLDIQHIVYWENPNERLYVVVSRESGADKVYTVSVNGSGNGVAVDRTPASGSFTASDAWSSTLFNGGYSVIINNGIEQPHHITVSLGTDLSSSTKFTALTGWESYASGSIISGQVSVSCGVIVSAGNLLIAGDLTERSKPVLPAITSFTSANPGVATFASSPSLSNGDRFTVYNSATDNFNSVEYTVNGVNGNVITTTTNTTSFSAFSAGNDLITFNTSTDIAKVIVRNLNGVVRSSSVASPGTIPINWDPFAVGAGTADELNLADSGRITAIRNLRGSPIVYTNNSITQLRVSGSGLSSIPVTTEYGAQSQSSVFEFKGNHIVIGSNDIYQFNGTANVTSLSDTRVRKYFFNDLHPTSFRKSKIVRNQQHDEIWIAYPSNSSSNSVGLLDKALVWSYQNNTWTKRDLPSNTTTLTAGPIPGGGAPADTYAFTTQSANGSVKVTVTASDGSLTELEGSVSAGHSSSQVATAFHNLISVQSDFNSRVSGGHVLVDKNPTSNNAPSISVRVVDTSTTTISPSTTGSFDSERPWGLGTINQAKNFVCFGGANKIYAADLTYGFAGSSYQSYVLKSNMEAAPHVTDSVEALYMQTSGTAEATNSETAAGELNVQLRRSNNSAYQPISFTTSTDNLDYPFRFAGENANYKVDTRIVSRLVNLKISNTSTLQWDIHGISVSLGAGGTR